MLILNILIFEPETETCKTITAFQHTCNYVQTDQAQGTHTDDRSYQVETPAGGRGGPEEV